jgi:hypothetical protein
MTRITLTRPELAAAASLCAGTEKHRPHTNGVHIAPAPAGGLHIVATDGHLLSVGHDPDGTMDGPAVTIRMDKKAWTAAGKAARMTVDGDRAEMFSDPDPDSGAAPAALAIVEHEDGATFPPWPRIIPQPHEPAPFGEGKPAVTSAAVDVTLSSLLLARIPPIAKLLRPGSRSAVPLHFSGAAGAPLLIRCEGRADWLGVIMPMRDGVHTAESPLPDWLATD